MSENGKPMHNTCDDCIHFEKYRETNEKLLLNMFCFKCPKMPKHIRHWDVDRAEYCDGFEPKVDATDNCNGGNCERHKLCAEPCSFCQFCDDQGNI